MEREQQYKQQKKRAIIVLSILLALCIVFNAIMWIITLTSNNGVLSVGNVNLEMHFFDGQKDSNLSFPKSEFVSEGQIERLLVLNNKSEDCYLRFWLVSKMGDNASTLQEVNNIVTLSAQNSFAQSGYELSIVENERYLTSSEGKIYYTTDNAQKESVFQKNTTASIKLTFDIADLSGQEYHNKVYYFELKVESISLNNQTTLNSWVVPTNWPAGE